MTCMSKIRDKKRKKNLDIKRAARANKEVLPSFKYLFSIAYDGSSFGGYAKQKHGNTIQNKLEKALEKIIGYYVSTTESSRTDAKVHALDQKVMIEINEKINIKKMQNSLNDLLNPEILIKSIELVSSDFHCRYDVKNKTYEYLIAKDYDPRYYNYSLYIKDELNIKRMNEALKCLIGTHDFKSFCSAKATSLTTVRTINYIEIIEEKNYIKFVYNADGFLYNMIRIIMHCIIEIGLEKESSNYLKEILELKEKPSYIESAPANGLCLIKINY